MDRTNQDQHFDSEYIDQLFSSRKSVSAKTDPAELPEDPPVEAVPQEPMDIHVPSAKPRFSAARTLALSLAAIALLSIGFMAGWLLKPGPEFPDAGTSAPDNSDYSSMSTDTLARKAARIEALTASDDRLTTAQYLAVREEYPILAELETRADAIVALKRIISDSPGTAESHGAVLLVIYYTAAGL